MLGHVRKQVVPYCTAWQWRIILPEGLKRLSGGESVRFPEALVPAAQDSNTRLMGDLSQYCR